MSSQPRLVEVRQNVLKQNDIVARQLRERFRDAGVYVVSLVASPAPARRLFLRKPSPFCSPTFASRLWSAILLPKTTQSVWPVQGRPSSKLPPGRCAIWKPP